MPHAIIRSFRTVLIGSGSIRDVCFRLNASRWRAESLVVGSFCRPTSLAGNDVAHSLSRVSLSAYSFIISFGLLAVVLFLTAEVSSLPFLPRRGEVDVRDATKRIASSQSPAPYVDPVNFLHSDSPRRDYVESSLAGAFLALYFTVLPLFVLIPSYVFINEALPSGCHFLSIQQTLSR